MTGIRKYRRAKAPWRDRATRPAKMPRESLLREYLLVAGLIMAGLGAFFGAHEYDVYCVGRLEGIDNGPLGTEYVPEVPAGDPGARTAAIAGFAVAAVGVGSDLLGTRRIRRARSGHEEADSGDSDVRKKRWM